jgi:sugar lactone lactonase YvrE
LLQTGDLLVSNFNSGSGVQGTGTTIVSITPEGQQTVFFQGPTGLGLSTVLAVLKSGYVIVGNVPTNISGVAQQGSLLILNSSGQIVTDLSDSALLNGPWDMTVNDQGASSQLFIANVLSGTVTRINLSIPKCGNPVIESETQIASGYAFTTNPSALVVGPTGLAFNAATDMLYVAATDNNVIYAVPNAAVAGVDHGTGKVIYNNASVLHGPLGLVLAP